VFVVRPVKIVRIAATFDAKSPRHDRPHGYGKRSDQLGTRATPGHPNRAAGRRSGDWDL
jgi:hypothetical protein